MPDAPITPATDEEIAELARLASEATPGPWFATEHGWISSKAAAPDEAIVVDRNRDIPNGWPDTDFIAAANPDMIERLIARIEAEKAAKDELAGALNAARPILAWLIEKEINIETFGLRGRLAAIDAALAQHKETT